MAPGQGEGAVAGVAWRYSPSVAACHPTTGSDLPACWPGYIQLVQEATMGQGIRLTMPNNSSLSRGCSTPPTRLEPILIAGAGIGGLATALGLARNGFDVVVLERAAVAGGDRRRYPAWSERLSRVRLAGRRRCRPGHGGLRGQAASDGRDDGGGHLLDRPGSRFGNVSGTHTRWCIAATCTAFFSVPAWIIRNHHPHRMHWSRATIRRRCA